MSELWIVKSTTDVHRLIDNKLPPGSVCTGVTMQALDDPPMEEYVAIINGQEVIVEAPPESSAEDVASEIVKGAPEPPVEPEPPWNEPTAENAVMEGAEIREHEPEDYEYADEEAEDEEDDASASEFDAPPKPKKSKTKKKK